MQVAVVVVEVFVVCVYQFYGVCCSGSNTNITLAYQCCVIFGGALFRECCSRGRVWGSGQCVNKGNECPLCRVYMWH